MNLIRLNQFFTRRPEATEVHQTTDGLLFGKKSAAEKHAHEMSKHSSNFGKAIETYTKEGVEELCNVSFNEKKQPAADPNKVAPVKSDEKQPAKKPVVKPAPKKVVKVSTKAPVKTKKDTPAPADSTAKAPEDTTTLKS